MEILSAWSDSVELPSFPALEGDVKTDVLIIGGGIAGLLCAYFLQQQGVDYILVEGKTICSGVTQNTTAKITAQHGVIYDKLIRSSGLDMASAYLKANLEAVEKLRQICENIDCDFENKDSFVYSLDDREKIRKESSALVQLGVKAEFLEQVSLPIGIAGAVKFPNQAQFNPLKFAAEVAKNLNIYEHTNVSQLTSKGALTAHGTISSNKIIVATHFPFINKHGSYFIKQYQHRSYVIALENAPNVGGMYVDEAEKGMSFRNYNNLLLIGGGDHRTGKTGGCWQELEDFAKRKYPDATVKYRWATQDCMSLDDIPYIGQYSKRTPNFYVATGFNKWGMTSSMVAAMMLSNMVTGKQSEYSATFSPSRCILKPQLIANIFEALAGMLTPTTKRCPHLGCGLRYNHAEHTWDCSCHGSRFDEQGKILENPANADLPRRRLGKDE